MASNFQKSPASFKSELVAEHVNRGQFVNVKKFAMAILTMVLTGLRRAERGVGQAATAPKKRTYSHHLCPEWCSTQAQWLPGARPDGLPSHWLRLGDWSSTAVARFPETTARHPATSAKCDQRKICPSGVVFLLFVKTFTYCIYPRRRFRGSYYRCWRRLQSVAQDKKSNQNDKKGYSKENMFFFLSCHVVCLNQKKVAVSAFQLV